MMIRITLKKSYIGTSEYMRRVLRALGLRKIGMTVERKDAPSIKGMIRKVSHLIEVEKV